VITFEHVSVQYAGAPAASLHDVTLAVLALLVAATPAWFTPRPREVAP